MGRESEKKILFPNSVRTQPGKENFEKNSKKIQKIKNLFPELFLAKTEWDRLRKREKNFSHEFRSYSTRARKLQKKKAKKFKKLKPIFPALFLAKTGWDRPRKREKNFSTKFR